MVGEDTLSTVVATIGGFAVDILLGKRPVVTGMSAADRNSVADNYSLEKGLGTIGPVAGHFVGILAVVFDIGLFQMAPEVVRVRDNPVAEDIG